MLKKCNVSYDSAESGKQAIESCCNNKYSLILMDLMMPNQSGTETVKILKEQGVTCPVVAVSACIMNEAERQELKGSGFADYLAKPVSLAQLLQTLCNFLLK